MRGATSDLQLCAFATLIWPVPKTCFYFSFSNFSRAKGAEIKSQSRKVATGPVGGMAPDCARLHPIAIIGSFRARLRLIAGGNSRGNRQSLLHVSERKTAVAWSRRKP